MTENDKALSALEEAMDWLLRLRDRSDDAETLRAFDEWLCRSDNHRAAWEKAQKTWRLMGDVPPVYQRSWQPPPVKSLPPARGAGWRIWTVGFGFALAACLALLFMPSVMLWFQADYTTRTAENRRITLEDGSVVDLGAGSAIKTDVTADDRRVVLLKGEAFFDVAHDAGRPFVVEAGGIEVTVLGTAFDVQLSSSQASVALARGIVGVSYDVADVSEDFELSPGEMAVIDRDSGEMVRSAIEQQNIGAWRSGRLFVHGVTIGSMVEQLQRYHPAWLTVLDRSLAARRITGLYDLKDPDRALRALVEPYGAHVRSVSAYARVLSSY